MPSALAWSTALGLLIGLTLSLLVVATASRAEEPTASADTVESAGSADAAAADNELESSPAAISDRPTAEQVEYFERHVRPVLAEHCYECHSGRAEELKAGLRVDGRAALLSGGDSGPAIVPGQPDESLMIQAMRHEGIEMPPTRKLDAAIVNRVAEWIAQGAPWPADSTSAADAGSTTEANSRAGAHGSAANGAGPEASNDWITRRAAAHWSWRPIADPLPPDIRQAEWPSGAIDRFILAEIERHELPVAQDADHATLVRRLYFDLIGLPPSIQQQDRWEAIAASDPNWYQRLVEELLESPQFGEKWARHWLDLVRYAETCGHEFDYPIYEAYRYRDYVIRAFNADVPYDQFLVEQLAGDLLESPRLHRELGFNESIIGTGFWFLGESVHAPTDVRADEVIRIDNQLDVLGKTFLGLTLACARCHDHKFDPIAAEDYYALTGVLQSSRRQFAQLDPHGRIADATNEIERLQVELNNACSSQLSIALPSVDELHAGLLAAVGLESPAEIDADPDRVAQWREKLTAEDARQPESPFSALLGNDEGRRPRGRRQRVEPEGEPWCDFNDEEFTESGWSATGSAFGTGPTTQPTWLWSGGGLALVNRGWAVSDRAGIRAQGVLRSPEFTLESPNIHYRLVGRNVTIRLIVDGYFMDEFNALLFADCQLKVNTDGATRWIAQHRDLDHYVGHRAHLEIIDQGDGFVRLDEIRFSSDGRLPPDVHGWTQQVRSRLAAVNEAETNPPSDGDADRSINVLLCRELAECWRESRERIVSGRPTEDDVRVVNWMQSRGLINWSTDQLDTLTAAIDQLQLQLPEPTRVLAITDGTPVEDRVHIRGSHLNLGRTVARRTPLVLGGEACGADASSGRLDLARKLIRPDNPLVARVAANRIWHHLMGRGIVPSVDDFGVMGQPPSHPELLDWLATDLVRNGWSMKHLIRRIVTSRTYRMSSVPADPAVLEIDLDNRWWSHASVRRLPAESIRDAVLSVSGQLDLKQFGPSVPVHVTPFMTGRGRPQSGPLDGEGRRTIYLEVRRNFLSPLLLTFDMPIPFSTVGRRSASNVPSQSLALLNDPLLHEQAEHWARAVLSATPPAAGADGERPDTSDERAGAMYRAAFGRRATPTELAAVRDFVARQAELRGVDQDAEPVWLDVAHVLFNTKEFIHLD